MQDLNSVANKLYFYRGMDIKDLRSCDEEEWKNINEKGYDVFWTLNIFRDGRRIKDNLDKFTWVLADFDSIDKNEFDTRFVNEPHPTVLVRTRGGLHAYWKLKDDPSKEKNFLDGYKQFMETSLVPLGADPNAKDVCRILRVPSSRYWQDSKGTRYEDKEIYCEVIYDDGPEWKWEQLKRLFSRPNGIRTSPRGGERSNALGISTARPNGGFWERANSIGVCEGLNTLSGSTFVNGESYKIRPEGKIQRIFINDKPSNAWVDEAGRIGSLHQNGGLPVAGTIVNWLNFPDYGHDMKAIAKIMKEVFNVE